MFVVDAFGSSFAMLLLFLFISRLSIASMWQPYTACSTSCGTGPDGVPWLLVFS